MIGRDERANKDVKAAKSIGYSIFWYGIFVVLLYRWFVLNQSLSETLDVFVIWLMASVIQFMALAIKGVPMTYPVEANKKEQRGFLFIAPLVTGIATAIILIFFRDGVETWRIIGGFAASFVGTLLLISVYKGILTLWEKKYLD